MKTFINKYTPTYMYVYVRVRNEWVQLFLTEEQNNLTAQHPEH